MIPVRIQLSRRRGWRMPTNTVKVDRSTPWGNRYKITARLSRARAIIKFWQFLTCTDQGKALVREAQPILAGKNLACWCPLGQPCHADVWLDLLNR